MASVASQLIEEVTAHAQSDSLKDAREICADGTHFPNNLHTYYGFMSIMLVENSVGSLFLFLLLFADDIHFHCNTKF